MHRVHLVEDGHTKEVVVNAESNGCFSSQSSELYYHHARLVNLKPGTKYEVVIESDGEQSPTLFFVTAPAKDVPVSILFGADSRSGHRERQQMNRMLARMVAESYQPNHIPILAFAHGGDYVESGADLAQWSQWMTDFELTVGQTGQLLPIIPARGNHDQSEMFNEVFAFPQGDTNYYATNIGPQLRLITLNTEVSVAGEQANWLGKELADSRPTNRWLIVQYHRPAYPAVKTPWTNAESWVPLFEQYDVDLACEGDGHCIKRTVPIRNNKVDPTGVVYIGEGGLGVGQRTPKAERWYLKQPHAMTGQGHHVQLLSFDDEKITYRVVMLGGELFDEHYLPVRKK